MAPVADPLGMSVVVVVGTGVLVDGLTRQVELEEFTRPVPVRNLIGARVTLWRRLVQTSGPPVSTTGRLGSERDRRRICEDATLSFLEIGPALWGLPRASAPPAASSRDQATRW